MKNSKTICFVAGKSGGHIIPALTKAHQIIRANPYYQILFFSTNSHLDQQIITPEKIINHHIALDIPHKPRSVWQLAKAVFQLSKSFIISMHQLRQLNPEKIISMGGAVSIPVCLAGKLLGIPVELYELNARPGRAVQFLARYADVIWLTYPQSRAYLPQKKCLLTRYPIRFCGTAACQETIRTTLGLKNDLLTILVLGGSQGSVGINNLIKQWIAGSSELPVQFIHQTGALDTTHWPTFYQQHHIQAHVFAYHDDMQAYYQAADIIICRAGAGTLAETIFFKKPCIIIPLKTDSTDHQKFNAQAMVQSYPHLCTSVNQQEAQSNISIFINAIRQHAQLLHKNF